MSFSFSKYHALGNDYIVIDPKTAPGLKLTSETIKLICHRNFGVGSDGILYGPIIMGGPSASFSVQIFNPDGSEAEKSGNGIRIFSRYLLDARYVTKEKPFTLKTLGGEVVVEFLKNSDLIKVNMGKALFQSDKIPVKGKSREVVNEPLSIYGQDYQVTCVSMGNPHCVIPLEKISAQLAHEIGPFVENHEMFPNRINMQLLKVLNRQKIQIEIWERGAGYTLASGSSSCAAAAVAHKLGLVDRSVDVTMPGGLIHIDIAEDGSIFMTGPVTKVATGVWEE